MKTSEYDQMALHEKTYWWHLGRLRIIEKQLRLLYKKKNIKILNIGCGTGGTLPVIEKFGDVTNIDVSKKAIEHLTRNGYKGTLFDGKTIPFPDKSFDLIVAFDVLEHIKYDQESLIDWTRVLKDDGRVFITVPAYGWLWSGHDISLHHWRRYTTGKLKWDLRKVSMTPDKLTYAIAFSLPLVSGFRLLSKLRKKQITEESSYVKLPGFVNKLFTVILYFEAIVLTGINLPFGTTVLGIFNKTREY